MKASYGRWSSLYDRQQSGARLSASELFELQTLSNEDACSRHEVVVRQQLSELACELQGSDDVVVERALAEANARDKVVPIKRQLESAAGAGARSEVLERRRRLRPALALGALAGVTLLALLLALGSEAPEPAEGVAGTSLSAARAVELTFTSGRVLVNGVPTVVSADPLQASSTIAVEQGRACLAMDAQTDVCIDAQSTVVLDDQQGQARNVRLIEGRVVAVLDKRSAPHSFSILSGALKATALGTAYSVERTAAGATTVTVMQGQVEVAVSERSARVIRAHEQLELTRGVSGGATQRTTRAEELRHWSLIEPRKLWKQTSVGILHIATEPGSATVSLDGTPLGQAPLSLLAASGAHELALELEQHHSMQHSFSLNPGQEKRVELPLRPKPGTEPALAPGSAPTQATARAPSAQQLLERARELVTRGQWQSAVRAYRRLRQNYPGSPESHTVLVALGQLELDRLGHPARALSSFNTYLKSGGGLSQEARFGRIRALRALGQTSSERQAIRDYLRHYPRSADAGALSKRLSQLEHE